MFCKETLAYLMTPPMLFEPVHLPTRPAMVMNRSYTPPPSTITESDHDSEESEEFKLKEASSRRRPPRSKNGCLTCRRRKVRCNQDRPKCAACDRLGLECDWTQQWLFKNWSNRTVQKHKNVQSGTSPAWDPKSIGLRRRHLPHSEPSPPLPFSSLKTDEDRETRALSKPPGTFGVILTPLSFVRVLQSDDAGTHPFSFSITARGRTPVQTELESEPDHVVLSRFDDDGSMETADSSDEPSSEIVISESRQMSVQISDVPTVSRNLSPTRLKLETLMEIHRTRTANKILPLASRLKLNLYENGQDILVAETENFSPLRHALAALTTLNLAATEQPNLLVGAFQLYDQALSASRTLVNATSDQLFFLHFILLLHDVSCSNQPWSKEGKMWSVHFSQLASMLYDEMATRSNYRTFISYYILYLDAQACLVGDTASGEVVEAYLNHDSRFQAAKAICSSEYFDPGNLDLITRIDRLSNAICSLFAQLSQIAMQIRSQSRERRLAVNACQAAINDFSLRLVSTWTSKCPDTLLRDPVRGAAKLSFLPKTQFTFAAVQYSMALVYLHTSMYPGQRLHSPHHAHLVAEHCTLLLDFTTQAIAAQGSANHHLVFSVFLAGFATLSDGERARSIQSLRAMEGTGIAGNATATRKLLQKVHRAQDERVGCGGRMEEVDWIDLAREDGLQLVNLGL